MNSPLWIEHNGAEVVQKAVAFIGPRDLSPETPRHNPAELLQLDRSLQKLVEARSLFHQARYASLNHRLPRRTSDRRLIMTELETRLLQIVRRLGAFPSGEHSFSKMFSADFAAFSITLATTKVTRRIEDAFPKMTEPQIALEIYQLR
ncbi:MAG TPA: hypothetical protein VK846_07820 [Candidatus Limnocylindria bacterium]|nr:hypothetical protein [Candidatus Limnocylindria bacterium]